MGNPSRRPSAAAAIRGAVKSASENMSTAVQVTTPVADTRRVEEELLAAFARTPKVARTPPKGSAPSASPGGAASFPARKEPAGEGLTIQLPALPSGGAASAPVAPPADAAGQQPRGPAPQPQPEQVTALRVAIAVASKVGAREVPNADPVGGEGAPVTEPLPKQVFGRSAKLSRTPPRSGEAAGLEAPVKGRAGESQPMQHGLGLPQVAVRATESAAGRSVQQPTAPAGGVAIGSPHRLASPSASVRAGTDGSCAHATNVRSLLGSESSTSDVAGSAVHRGRASGALTPAAFEGMISVMRTPCTGMKRRNALVNEVPQMKPLDAVRVATAHRPANAPRGQVPPRATTWAGVTRHRYGSSVEEAKAAAEAAARATAAKKALAAAEAAIAAVAPTTTSSAEPPAARAGDVQAPPAGPPSAPESALATRSPGGLPAPSAVVGDSDVGPVVSELLPPGEEEIIPHFKLSAPAAADGPDITEGGEVELPVDPIAPSQKLPRTPTTPPPAPSRKTTTMLTAEVSAPSSRPSAGDDRGTDGVPDPKSQQEAVTPVPPESDGKGGDGDESPGAVVDDPFARRSNIPRTPTDQVVPVPPRLSLFQESVEAGGGLGAGGDAEAMDLEGARLQIRELNQELACKRDSLAKQSEERKRLADAAFEAQDEAAKLRQRLEEIQAQIQQQQQLNKEGGGDDGLGLAQDSAKGKGKDNGKGNGPFESGESGQVHTELEAELHGEGGSSSADREMGEDGEGKGKEGETDDVGAEAGAGVGAVELTAERVVQLEIEKWETEQGKREAEKEAQRAAEAARQAKVALDEAQTKVRELTLSAEAQHEETLAEKLRRAREQCKQDERVIEEHQIKVKLFVADKRAEILRAQVSEEERLKMEQSVRAAAVAVAGKACKVVQELVACNARMSKRVAGLRANLEEREELVFKLKERSALLEASGRSTQHETEEVRNLLAAATQELEAVKRSREALKTRLGPLEQECREAQTAQENLRALVNAEEARRVSVERRLSEVKRSGENVVGIERARRQSTERRLGLAERTRDELAAAAAAAASTALREAVETEKSRRMSVERRLEYAERARTELSATVAESAASAAAAAASAAAASTAASEAAALSRSKGRAVVSPSGGAAPSPPAASAPVPTKKAVKSVVKKSSKKAESAAVGGAAAASDSGGVRTSPPPAKATKRAGRRAVEEDESDGASDGKGNESTPAKVAQRRQPSPSKKRAHAVVRAKPSGTKKVTTTRNGDSSLFSSSSSPSDSDFDGRDDAAAVPVPTKPTPTITTGRTGRKRKQINYAEPSPLTDRSVIAALSDSSDDEYDPPAPPSKKSRAAADLGGARTWAGSATKAASTKVSTAQSRKEIGEHKDRDGEEVDSATSTTQTYEGKGKAKSSPSVPAAAKAGSSGANAAPREKEAKHVDGGDRKKTWTAPVEAAAAVKEKSEKKRRLSTAAGKKGENTPVDAAMAKGGDSLPATSSKGSKRKSVGRASQAKAVEKSQQDASIPTPVAEGVGQEAAGASGAGLLSTDLSPIGPPQKRSRKLLGGGTSRCKTPKAKKTAAAAASRADHNDDDDDDDHDDAHNNNDENAAAPTAAPAGAAPPMRVTGVVTGVGPKSGSNAAAAKRAPPLAPASRAGAGATSGKGAGGDSGGGGGAAAAAPVSMKPAVKPLKLSTNSILAMRGKSTMRTSLFKGFLDPKNGFKAPKLKAGTLRR
eukprot:g15411.t1